MITMYKAEYKSTAYSTLCAATAPPTLTRVSPSFVVGREGAAVEMRCDASGVPAPSVSWLKDGHLLDVAASPLVTTTHDDRRLVFRHLVRADAAIYTCLFKNSVAQTSHDIRLVVEGFQFQSIRR